MGKPTEKQLIFARNIADRFGLEIPQEALDDGKACSEFIDKHNKPTEKQLELARKIVDTLNVKGPSDYDSPKEVSSFIGKYIDEYRASFKK